MDTSSAAALTGPHPEEAEKACPGWTFAQGADGTWGAACEIKLAEGGVGGVRIRALVGESASLESCMSRVRTVTAAMARNGIFPLGGQPEVAP